MDTNADLAKIAKDVRGYELCTCYAFPDVIPVCGCGEKHLRLYRDHVIHWLGQHWEIECAFQYAIDGLSQGFNLFKYMEDEGVV